MQVNTSVLESIEKAANAHRGGDLVAERGPNGFFPRREDVKPSWHHALVVGEKLDLRHPSLKIERATGVKEWVWKLQDEVYAFLSPHRRGWWHAEYVVCLADLNVRGRWGQLHNRFNVHRLRELEGVCEAAAADARRVRQVQQKYAEGPERHRGATDKVRGRIDRGKYRDPIGRCAINAIWSLAGRNSLPSTYVQEVCSIGGPESADRLSRAIIGELCR